jgi:hypothetical protein
MTGDVRERGKRELQEKIEKREMARAG